MQHSELSISDEDIVNEIANNWQFKTDNIEYIEFGSTFAFKLKNTEGLKAFLKLYKKIGQSVIINNYTHPTEFLHNSGQILERLHTQHNIKQIPVYIKTIHEEYFHETADFVFVLLSHIEGEHPSYEPNELNSLRLADTLSKLHSVPISEYPEVIRDNFNIDYALGLEKWLNYTGEVNENIKPMLTKITDSREFIQRALRVLIDLQARFVNLSMEFVLSHGDPHHFNVLQTSTNLFLIDWDDIRIGPRERDLWHYEFASLVNDYLNINLGYAIDHDLCMYYQLLRFLEDLRIYIEEKTSSQDQANENIKSFFNHWGWKECYKRINNYKN